MERTYINEAQKAIGGTVKVQGFIENLRNSKYMAFIVLKDITGKLQITVEKEDHPDLVDTIDQLTPDSVITVTGKVVENDYVKMGGVEMIPESIEIESIANALPIVRKEIAATKKKKAVERSSIDQRIDYRWIDLRTDENQLMFKAQSCFVNAMRKFLLDRNFIEIHTPKLIAAASESGSEVFKVDYFDRNAYLAQSPQFYKQMAMAAGFERIFETGPVFRAEKSYTYIKQGIQNKKQRERRCISIFGINNSFGGNDWYWKYRRSSNSDGFRRCRSIGLDVDFSLFWIIF